MYRAPIIIAGIVSLLFLPLITRGDESQVSRASAQCHDLQLSASVNTRTPAHKKVIATVRLINRGDRTVTSSCGPWLYYRLFDSNDKPVPTTARGAEQFEDGKPLFIRAGETIDADCDVYQYFQIRKDDLYRLAIRVRFDDQDDKEWGQLDIELPFYIGSPPTPWKQPPGGI